jgi:hypothetical protein
VIQRESGREDGGYVPALDTASGGDGHRGRRPRAHASHSGGIAAALLSRDARLRRLAAGAVGLATGSLVSIVIALQSSFFGYQEPTLRFPIVLAIIAEAAVLPVLGLLLLRRSPAAVTPAGS